MKNIKRCCNVDCKNCPWVDFWDYELCGLINPVKEKSSDRK